MLEIVLDRERESARPLPAWLRVRESSIESSREFQREKETVRESAGGRQFERVLERKRARPLPAARHVLVV